MEVFSARNNQVLKTFAKFKEQAYSGSFRGDGKLLVAGGEEGCVRLFDVSRKALLRTFKEHSRYGFVCLFKFSFTLILNVNSESKCVCCVAKIL